MAVDLIIEDNGTKRKKSDIDFVEKIIRLKNTQGVWPVIDQLLQRWVKTSPEEAQALQIQIEDQREMLIDKEFGTTQGGKDFERRFTLVFPLRLMQMIRAIFPTEEVEFDRKFYQEFVKRYPNFKIAEKQ